MPPGEGFGQNERPPAKDFAERTPSRLRILQNEALPAKDWSGKGAPAKDFGKTSPTAKDWSNKGAPAKDLNKMSPTAKDWSNKSIPG